MWDTTAARLLGLIGLFSLVLPMHVRAGTITFEVLDDKGTIEIPNGHFEMVFTSRMSLDLGSEWGDLAGHYERRNGEKLVWVNDGPPILINFANVFPRELHVPQTQAPDPGRVQSFFDVFFMIEPNGSWVPLEPGMQIVPGPDTFLQGSSGTKFPGIVTPINDLTLLPTSGINGTEVVWDLSQFSTTIGNFYLIEYQVPPIELVPEPATLILTGVGLLALSFRNRSRRQRSGLS